MQLMPVDLQILARLEAGMTQAQIGSDLGIEQPAVSKAIRAAEARLGMPLLEPGRRSRLSSVGRELARAGLNALRQLQGVDDVIDSLRAGHANYARIVASNTPATYLLPQVVARFLQAYQDAYLDVEVVPMPRLWEAFLSGDFDLAIAPRMPFEGDVIAEPVYVDRVILFAAPSHRLAHRGRVGYEDLRDETLVGKLAEAYWGQVQAELKALGFTWAHEVDLRSAEAVKRIVASGIGVGMLFASSLDEELRSGTLVSLDIANPAFAQTYFLVRRTNATRPLAAAFAQFLRSLWCRAALI